MAVLGQDALPGTPSLLFPQLRAALRSNLAKNFPILGNLGECRQDLNLAIPLTD
jgi:hypothetical protein